MKLLIEEILDILMVSIFKTVPLVFNFYFSSLAFARMLFKHCFSYLLQNEINYLISRKFKHNNTKIGTDCSVMSIKLYNVCFLWKFRLTCKNTTPLSTTITNKFHSFYTINVSQWI